MWTLYTTVNYETDHQDLSPFTDTLSHINHLIRTTVEAYTDATSFEFILVPKPSEATP